MLQHPSNSSIDKSIENNFHKNIYLKIDIIEKMTIFLMFNVIMLGRNNP
jgi:hypothetical protein